MNTEFVDRHLPPGRPTGRQVLHTPSAVQALRPTQFGALDTGGVVTQ